MAKIFDKGRAFKLSELDQVHDALCKDICKSEEEMVLLYKSGSGFIQKKDQLFKQNKDTASLIANLMIALAKLIEKKDFSEEVLSNLIHQCFAENTDASTGNLATLEQFKTGYLEEVNKFVSSRFNYLARCELFVLADGIKGLATEYVEIISLWDARRLFSEEMETVLGTEFKIVNSNFGEQYAIQLTEYLWHIRSNTSRSNVQIEAAWMAGVFTSFFRLSIRGEYCHRPKFGEAEAYLGAPLHKEQSGMSINDDNEFTIGSSLHARYMIDQKVINFFDKEITKLKLNQIFESNKNTLGERIRNALGWLARARQSADYSERLMFNFTALESLFSTKDGSSPVSDTISRSISVVLAKEPADREEICVDIKMLYELRSQLVHRGHRTTNSIESNDVESVAERCVQTILWRCDLNNKHDVFLKGLKTASHGAVWDGSCGE